MTDMNGQKKLLSLRDESGFFMLQRKLKGKRGRGLIWLLVHGDGQNMVCEISENMFVIQIKRKHHLFV